ncbi:MAG: DUF5320 domain-containing protein [Kiritimatiellales bacterium]|nr:DUF5320 domain-containing protein [Kiritimatiellales bacterium]
MPAGDRTGPEGMGPMTGRGAGYCAGFGAPGFVSNAGPGFGYGRGRGRGRGMGRGYGVRQFGNWGTAVPYTPPTRDQQLEELKAHSKYLESELETIRERIGSIESES